MAYTGSSRSIPGVAGYTGESEPFIRYLDVNGSDSNDGISSGTAWRTWKKATDWLGKVLDKKTCIRMNGDFSADGVFELNGLRTADGGSLAILGAFVNPPISYAVNATIPSPTDLSGIRIQAPLTVPGIPAPVNPWTKLISLGDGASFFTLGTLLDYDQPSSPNEAWVDPSQLTPLPAGGSIGFHNWDTHANFSLNDCDAVKDGLPNIVIAGFGLGAAPVGLKVKNCKGVEILFCDMLGGIVEFDGCECVRIGVWANTSDAEQRVPDLFAAYPWPLTEVSCGYVSGTSAFRDCQDIQMAGTASTIRWDRCTRLSVSRTRYYSGSNRYYQCKRVVENNCVYETPIEVKETEDFEPDGVYFHSSFGQTLYPGYGSPAIQGYRSTIYLPEYLYATPSPGTDPVLIFLDRCKTIFRLVGLGGWVADANNILIEMEQCDIYGDNGGLAYLSNTPPFNTVSVCDISMSRCRGFFFEVSKLIPGNATPCPVIRADQCHLRVTNLSMDIAGNTNFGPQGIVALQQGEMSVVNVAGVNLGGQDDLTLRYGAKLWYPAGAVPVGTVFLGALGPAIPWPAATLNDLPAAPTGAEELCAILR